MTTKQTCEWRYLMTPARAEAPEAVFGVRFGCRGERGSWMTTAEVTAATHCLWCGRRIVHENAPAFSVEEMTL